MRSWATKREVLREFRMLTKKQAVYRQLYTVALLSLFIIGVCVLSNIAARLVNSILIFVFFYAVLEVLFNLSKPKNTPAQEAFSYDKIDDTEGDDDLDYYYIKKHNLSPYARKSLIQYSIASSFAVLSFVFTPVTSFTFPRYAGMFALVFGVLFFVFNGYVGKISKMNLDEFSRAPKMRFYRFIRNNFSYTTGSYFIGVRDGNRIGLPRKYRYTHTLIVGPTGEQKTTSLIEPQLLFDADSPGSALVPDAKSPNLFYSAAGRWIKAGKRAFLFDPWHEDTVAINMLPDADDRDLLTIIEVFMKERDEVLKEDPFFKSRTKYLMYAMLKMVQTWKDKYCNLPAVYYLAQSVETLERFIAVAPATIQTLFSDFSKLTGETKVNALTSIKDKLDIFMDPDVRRAFSRSDFKLEMLFQEGDPCLLVIGSHIDKEEQGQKIASMLVNLTINLSFKERSLQKVARQKGRRSFNPPDLYLYLDELRKLKITRLADLISIARESKTVVIGSVTDLGFFKYYGPDYSSFLTNFRTKIVMGGVDIETAKVFSESLKSSTEATFRLYGGSVMVSQEEKPLLNPARIQRLPSDKILVFPPIPKMGPFILNKASIFDTDWLKEMQVPPPKDMKEKYREWGLSTEPLIDPVLPKLPTGDFNMADIIDETKREIDPPKITLEYFFKELGGGKYIQQKKEEVAGYTPTGNIDNVDALLFGDF